MRSLRNKWAVACANYNQLRKNSICTNACVVVRCHTWASTVHRLCLPFDQDVMKPEAAWTAMMLVIGQESDADRLNILRLILRDTYVTTAAGQKLIDQLSHMGIYPRDVVEMWEYIIALAFCISLSWGALTGVQLTPAVKKRTSATIEVELLG